MNIHTLTDHVRPYLAVPPQAVVSSGFYTGSGIDCWSWEGALLIVELGAIVDTANISLNVKLQESSDDGVADDYADVTDAETGATLNAGQNEVYLIELNMSERERYLRAIVEGGSVGGGLVSATLVPYRGRHLPPTQQNTVVQIEFERA